MAFPELPEQPHLSTGLCGLEHLIHHMARLLLHENGSFKGDNLFPKTSKERCANPIRQQEVSLQNDSVKGDASNGRTAANRTYLPISPWVPGLSGLIKQTAPRYQVNQVSAFCL